jgi:hypothetical protein
MALNKNQMTERSRKTMVSKTVRVLRAKNTDWSGNMALDNLAFNRQRYRLKGRLIASH